MPSFVSLSTDAPSSSSTKSSSSSSSIPSTARRSTRSLAWSLVCSLVLFNFVSVISPSTTGAQAALTPGFCGDCQTFSNSIQQCGGSFGNADIEIVGEYVLQQQFAKCICSDVMQKVLWTCAKCEVLAGFAQAKAPPPQKYQTQCMAWGITIQEWKAPYTGVVAPGTQTDVTGSGGSTTNPANPAPSTTNPSGGNGNGGDGSTTGPGGSKPSGTGSNPPTSSDNAESGNGSTTQSSSGLNTTAVGISVGIIGVALVAGIFAVVVMKRRRRRHTPLDLDSLPGQGGFVGLEDKWEKPHHPASPALAPVHVASAPPMMGGRGGHRAGPYEGGHGGHGGYNMEGSVVGGYDPQYDNYDQYRGAGGNGGGAAYDGYGQYPNQYGAEQQQYVGYHPNHGHERYPSNDYNYSNEKGQYL